MAARTAPKAPQKIVTRKLRPGGIRGVIRDFFAAAAGKVYYKAAHQSDRMSEVEDAGPNSHNDEIPVLRARSRKAKANYAFFRQAIRQVANNAVGYGIRPVIADQELEKLWNAWVAEADARGHFDFYGLQWHAVEAMVTDGEVLLRLRDRLDGDMVSGVPLQLQILEADHLPVGHNHSELNGNYVLDGIERNAIDRIVRYHVLPRHPLDWRGRSSTSLTPIPVPAEDICHLFVPERPTSERGIPWGATILDSMEMFSEYQLAEVAKKSITSKVTTFYTRPINEEAGFGDEDGDPNFSKYEMGAAVEVPEGYDVKFAEMPNTDPNYEAYVRTVLSEVGVAFGLCFELITLDFKNITDRSYRAIMLQVTKFVESIVYHVICRLNRKVWMRFLKNAAVAGVWKPAAGKRIEDYYAIEFMMPPRGHVHPVQEIQALVEAIKAGLISRQQAAAEMGVNTLEIDLQNKVDIDRGQLLGIVYSVFSDMVTAHHERNLATPANDNPGKLPPDATEEISTDQQGSE
ncbi:lambda family phage portal protein [Sinorhizobium fredii]